LSRSPRMGDVRPENKRVAVIKVVVVGTGMRKCKCMRR
jgi:hypothetical protein